MTVTEPDSDVDVHEIADGYDVDLSDAQYLVVHESLERGTWVGVLEPGDDLEFRNDEPTRTRVFALE